MLEKKKSLQNKQLKQFHILLNDAAFQSSISDIRKLSKATLPLSFENYDDAVGYFSDRNSVLENWGSKIRKNCAELAEKYSFGETWTDLLMIYVIDGITPDDTPRGSLGEDGFEIIDLERLFKKLLNQKVQGRTETIESMLRKLNHKPVAILVPKYSNKEDLKDFVHQEYSVVKAKTKKGRKLQEPKRIRARKSDVQERDQKIVDLSIKKFMGNKEIAERLTVSEAVVRKVLSKYRQEHNS